MEGQIIYDWDLIYAAASVWKKANGFVFLFVFFSFRTNDSIVSAEGEKMSNTFMGLMHSLRFMVIYLVEEG